MFVLEYIGENMSPLVPWMALMWFVLGILVGQRSLQGPPRRRSRGGNRPRRPRRGAVELYVGNLSYAMKETELEEAFSAYGTVELARVIKNGYSGKSKGYGFVVMAERDAAVQAMEGLNGSQLAGREISVNEARTKSRAH